MAATRKLPPGKARQRHKACQGIDGGSVYARQNAPSPADSRSWFVEGGDADRSQFIFLALSHPQPGGESSALNSQAPFRESPDNLLVAAWEVHSY